MVFQLFLSTWVYMGKHGYTRQRMFWKLVATGYFHLVIPVATAFADRRGYYSR